MADSRVPKKAILKRLEQTSRGGNKTARVWVTELLPVITRAQDEGYTLKQIYDAINEETPDFKMTFHTFRLNLQRLRKEALGVDALPKGRNASHKIKDMSDGKP